MPIQELKNDSFASSLGRITGQGIGGGLSGMIQAFAESKTKRMHEKQQMRDLHEAFPDLPLGALKFLASQPPKEQLQYLQAIGESSRQQPTSGQPTSGSPTSGQPQEAPFSLGNITPEQKQEFKEFASNPENIKSMNPEQQQRMMSFLNQEQQQELPAKDQPYFGVKAPQIPATTPQVGTPQVGKPQVGTPRVGKPSSGLPLSSLSRQEKTTSAGLSQKEKADIEKQQKAKGHVQSAYGRVQEILDSGYTGYSLSGLSPEGRKLRSELDTLSEVFISNLIPLLNPKGTMSKERFNYIKNLAPNSWDTDAAMKGKLSALKEIFELNEGKTGKGTVETKDDKGTVEMKDDEGNIYDIPHDQVNKAKKGGLK